MINCNPETVSTDYDTSDRLYFEPLRKRKCPGDIEKEKKKGKLRVIVQFGGQAPIKLAKSIHEAGYQILGTQLNSIDLAEDRERFSKILKIKLKQADNGLANSKVDAIKIAKKIGFPLVIRPSYVLGGRSYGNNS